jgi:hypothetical protein
MFDKVVIIDHDVASFDELEAATHYRSGTGEVSIILTRDRICPVCTHTTKITTTSGTWSTFNRLHLWSGCFRKMRDRGLA